MAVQLRKKSPDPPTTYIFCAVDIVRPDGSGADITPVNAPITSIGWEFAAWTSISDGVRHSQGKLFLAYSLAGMMQTCAPLSATALLTLAS